MLSNKSEPRILNENMEFGMRSEVSQLSCYLDGNQMTRFFKKNYKIFNYRPLPPMPPPRYKQK